MFRSNEIYLEVPVVLVRASKSILQSIYPETSFIMRAHLLFPLITVQPRESPLCYADITLNYVFLSKSLKVTILGHNYE